MTPTGSWPRISPGLTGYSPRTMCTSVPQIVVVVILMTASPARGVGRGTSSTAIRFVPLNTTAFIVFMATSAVAAVQKSTPAREKSAARQAPAPESRRLIPRKCTPCATLSWHGRCPSDSYHDDERTGERSSREDGLLASRLAAVRRAADGRAHPRGV